MVFYINDKGRAKSLPLCLEAARLWNGCTRNGITIQSMYLPRVQYSLPDNLNRRFSADCEGEMHSSVLNERFIQWGPP